MNYPDVICVRAPKKTTARLNLLRKHTRAPLGELKRLIFLLGLQLIEHTGATGRYHITLDIIDGETYNIIVNQDLRLENML